MFLNQSEEFIGQVSFGGILAQVNMAGPLAHFWQLWQFKVTQLQVNKIKCIIDDAHPLCSNFYPLIQW